MRERSASPCARPRSSARPAGAHTRAGDVPAAVGLLERTAALLDSDDPGRVAVSVELGAALHAGGQFDRADLVLTEATAAAGRLGDERLLAHAELEHAFVRMYSEPERALPRLEEVAETAVDVFARFDDDAGLARAWRVVAGGQFGRGHYADAAETLDRAIAHAGRAGADSVLCVEPTVVLLWRLGIAVALGPVPADEALARTEQILPRVGHNLVGEGVTRALIARLHGMLGHEAEARVEYARARAAVERLGDSVYAAALALYAGPVEQYAGDLAGAERELRAAVERLARDGREGCFLDRCGTAGARSPRAPRLRRGRGARRRERGGGGGRGRVLADALTRRAGPHPRRSRRSGAAVPLAHDTVNLAHETDGLSLQGSALLDLALVLDATGEGAAAQEALRRGARAVRRQARSRLAGARHAT